MHCGQVWGVNSVIILYTYPWLRVGVQVVARFWTSCPCCYTVDGSGSIIQVSSVPTLLVSLRPSCLCSLRRKTDKTNCVPPTVTRQTFKGVGLGLINTAKTLNQAAAARPLFVSHDFTRCLTNPYDKGHWLRPAVTDTINACSVTTESRKICVRTWTRVQNVIDWPKYSPSVFVSPPRS